MSSSWISIANRYALVSPSWNTTVNIIKYTTVSFTVNYQNITVNTAQQSFLLSPSWNTVVKIYDNDSSGTFLKHYDEYNHDIDFSSCLMTRPFSPQRPLPIWTALSDRMEVPTRTFRADWAKPGTPLGVWMQSGDHHSKATRLNWSTTRAMYCRLFCMDQSAGGWPSMTLPSCRPFTRQASGKSNPSFGQEPSPTVTS